MKKMVENKSEQVSWLFQIVFNIKKDIGSGEVEEKLKSLGESVEILKIHRDQVIIKPDTA